MDESSNQKPYLMFGTPRSGTTLYYHILESYLKQTRNIIGLGEFFNYSYQSFWDTGDGIGISTFPQAVRFNKLVAATVNNEILKFRFELLKKYHGRYFFKTFLLDSPRESLKYMAESYQWIFVERKNLFEQLLSYLISLSTSVWYGPKAVSHAPGHYVAQREDLVFFEGLIEKYALVKERIRPEKILVYEDYVNGPDLSLVPRRIGFTDPFNPALVWIPPKQNEGSKIDAFKNAKEIENFYRNSFMNELYKI